MNIALQTEVKTTSTPALVSSPVQNGLLQRKCPRCGSRDEEPGDEQKKQLNLQRRSIAGTGLAAIPPVVHEVLSSPGEPLDRETRTFMEPRFGHDFSNVRVHTDTKAAESAREVNALAYTVGQTMVFGAGQFAPGTSEGRKLLAHELTHTIQQGSIMPYTVVTGQSTAVREGKPVRIARQLNSETPDAGKTDTETPDAGVHAQAPLQATASCPVKKVGTLSEVSWGETSGIYPTKDKLYQPDKWDEAKTCELLKARAAVHEVGKRGQSVKRSKPGTGNIEKLLKPYHFIENFPTVDTEISDKSVKWFYLGKNPDKPDVHPGTTGTERVKSYGSFYNIGGGDAPKGDIYIHFYRLKTPDVPVK